MKLPAVLLAAGASRRLGRPKQLLQVEGESLLHRSARLALEAGFDPVVVVLGAGIDDLRPVLLDLPVQVASNPAWEEGVASSIQAGLAVLADDVAGAAFLVCDQPALDRGHLEALRRIFEADPERAVASTYAGTRGIPAILPRSAFDRLARLAGNQGAKALLGDANPIPFPGGELDLDTPEDLRGWDRLRR